MAADIISYGILSLFIFFVSPYALGGERERESMPEQETADKQDLLAVKAFVGY